MMQSSPDHRQQRRFTIAYWEKRRLLFNLLMLPAAGITYLLRTGVSSGVGDTRYMQNYQVAGLFVLALIIANACYSSVYAFEFFVDAEGNKSPWLRIGRWVLLVIGCIFGIIFAVTVAQSIAGAEYSPPT